MHTRIAAAVLSSVFGAAILITSVNAQQLSDVQIADAIKAGESRNFKHLASDCLATAGFGEKMGGRMKGALSLTGSFDVTVSTNMGRIAYMAAQAKRLYKSFAIADVTESLKVPGVFVSVEPNAPMMQPGGGGARAAAPIERVVLQSKSKPDAVAQPTSVNLEPVPFMNKDGGKVEVEANRAVAVFDYSAVRQLPAGDLDVVVITTSGERKCKIGAKDRERLIPAGS